MTPYAIGIPLLIAIVVTLLSWIAPPSSFNLLNTPAVLITLFITQDFRLPGVYLAVFIQWCILGWILYWVWKALFMQSKGESDDV